MLVLYATGIIVLDASLIVSPRAVCLHINCITLRYDTIWSISLFSLPSAMADDELATKLYAISLCL